MDTNKEKAYQAKKLLPDNDRDITAQAVKDILTGKGVLAFSDILINLNFIFNTIIIVIILTSHKTARMSHRIRVKNRCGHQDSAASNALEIIKKYEDNPLYRNRDLCFRF